MGIKEGFKHWASFYKSKGFNPVPCREDGKRPIGGWETYQTVKITDEEIHALDQRYPNCNIGGVQGATTNYCIVDVDGGGYEVLKSLGIELPTNTPIVHTGGVTKTDSGEARDRFHIYYTITGSEALLEGLTRVDKLFTNKEGKAVVELRIKDHFTVLPPSIHPITGYPYEWHNGQDLSMPMAELPVWVTDAVKAWKAQKKDRKLIDNNAPILEGSRDTTIYNMAVRMYFAGISYENAKDMLLKENTEKCNPPLTEQEVMAKLDSAWKCKATRPLYPLNDDGNADRFMYEYGKTTTFNVDTGKWLLFNGKYWGADLTGTSIYGKCIHITKTIPSELPEDADPKQVGKWEAFSTSCGNFNKITAMQRAISSKVGRLTEDFDQNPYLFNCANGTLELGATVRFREHRPGDLMAKCSGVVFDPSAGCPRWEQFLNEIFDGNTGIIRYVQQVLGYAMTGSNKEQVFFILHGTGGNGKSTMMETVRKVLGDYVNNAQFDTFAASTKSNDTHNDIAKFVGSRLVTAAETEPGTVLNTSLIKQITGGEPMTVRFLFKEFFDFIPTFKIFLQVNEEPIIRDYTDGIWRRMRKIPFNLRIAPDKMDRTLPEKLAEELSGILNWCIAGCIDWAKHGLVEVAGITEATQEYRENADPSIDFTKFCIKRVEGSTVPLTDLYTAYKVWAKDEEFVSKDARWLAKRLVMQGFKKKKTNKGIIFEDIKLISDPITSF